MSSIIKVDTVQDQDGNNIINENANVITVGASGDTITIPSGATLANNGTATGFASIAWQSSIVTASTLTAVAGNGYWINTTSNACTITLPASASVGDTIEFSDYLRTWGTNSITINQNSLNFQGYTSPNPEYNTNGQSVRIVYSGATQGWIPTVDDDVTLETSQYYPADFLVVAGGGGGGSGYYAGGAGAGGYRYLTGQTFGVGTVYTITVGDGGAGSTSETAHGIKGSNSSISGTGLTTITSTGGGGGGSRNSANGGGNAEGQDGGSGGGSSTNQSGFGAGNTPSTSPSQGNNGGSAGGITFGGAGGGAGATGANGNSDNTGEVGGVGLANSITGSSVNYAGGGSSGRSGSSTVPANAFGGGTGGSNDGTKAGGNGTANTGGGGGGASGDGSGSDDSGGTGGKGVVILSIPDAYYSGTTSGSPTVATGVSGKTILTFTGTGSYTA